MRPKPEVPQSGALFQQAPLRGSIEAARRIGMIKAASVDHVIVDTTAMPKAVAFPTDSRLLEKSRQHLVKLANDHQIDLRQNYNREAPPPSCRPDRALCPCQIIQTHEESDPHPQNPGRPRPA